MYKKVIVLEIKEAYVLAMEEGGTVVRIRKKEGLRIGDEIYILDEDVYGEGGKRMVCFSLGGEGKDRKSPGKQNKKTVYMRFAGLAAVAAMIVLCISFTVPLLSGTAYAQASFDGEACVQVTLNEEYEITGAVSPDGSLNKEDVNSLVGKSLEDAGAQIRNLCGEGSILIGYAFLDEEHLDEMFDRELRQLFAGQTILCLSGNSSDVKAADGSVMSLGKYLMEQQNAGADLDDLLEELSLEQLEQMLREDPSWMRNEDFRDTMLEYHEKRAETEAGEEEELPDAEETTDTEEEAADLEEADDKKENNASDDDSKDTKSQDTEDAEDTEEDVNETEEDAPGDAEEDDE